MFKLITLIFTLVVQAMIASYGRVVTYTTGTAMMAAAGPLAKLNAKAGGLTLDWTTIAAAGSDQTLIDGTVIPTGQKGLALGQVVCKITATGFYGPYDSGAADGRQLLNRGDCWILNTSVLKTPPMGLGATVTDHPAGYNGGLFFKDRVLVVTGQAATYLGATSRPALAAFETAFPMVNWVNATS